MHIFNVIVAGFVYWLSTVLNNYGTWAIWISLEGCYRNISGATDKHALAENNGPMHCFGVCPNSTYIGLQEIFCFCDAKPVDSTYAIEGMHCNYTCRGEKGNLPCGSEKAIYVYRQETLQLKNSIFGEFGYVYVRVPGTWPNQFDYYATNNTSEEQNVICYAGYTCFYKPLGNMAMWEAGRNQCLNKQLGFRPYHYEDALCSPPRGEFWIGVIWMTPALIVTTKESTTVTTSRSTELNITTSKTTYIPLFIHNSSVAGTVNQSIETTMLSDEKKIMTATGEFIGSVVGAIIIVALFAVICMKKRILFFKRNKERAEDQESIHTDQDQDSSLTPGPADVESRESKSNRDTSEKKHTVNSEEAMRDIETNIDDPARNSHRLGGPSIVPGSSNEHRTKLDKNDQQGGTSVKECTNMEDDTENHGRYADVFSLTTGYSYVKSEGKDKTMKKTKTETYAEPQQSSERNIATASGVRLSVENLLGPMYDNRDPSEETNNDHNTEKKRKKKKNKSKRSRDRGEFDMPAGKSKKMSRKKLKNSRVSPVPGTFDVPAKK